MNLHDMPHLGLLGSTPLAPTVRLALVGLPLDARATIEDAHQTATRAGLFDHPAFCEAWRRCSPADAVTCAALVEPRSIPGTGWYSDRLRLLEALRLGPPPSIEPWSSLPMERMWPLAAALSFLRYPEIWGLVPPLDDPGLRYALEVFLLAKPDDLYWNNSAKITAELREKIGPISDSVVAQAATKLRAFTPPARYQGVLADGIFALLGRARRDDAIELLIPAVTLNSYGALAAARHHGDSPASRALLHALWGQPDRHPKQVAADSALLARHRGDPQAAQVATALLHRAARYWKRVQKM